MKRAVALGLMGVLCMFTGSASAQLVPPPPFGAPSAAPPGYPQSPPGAPGTGPQSGTVAQLNQAENEDSGRRLELVYAAADVGGGFFAGGGSGSGLFGFGAAVGVRLVSFTLGARVRDLVGSSNTLLLNAEAAYHLVLGSADLVLGAHGGFATVTNAGGGSGGNVGLDVGLDYYLSSLFSVGGAVSPGMYFGGGDPVFGLFVGPRAGLHFGL